MADFCGYPLILCCIPTHQIALYPTARVVWRAMSSATLCALPRITPIKASLGMAPIGSFRRMRPGMWSRFKMNADENSPGIRGNGAQSPTTFLPVSLNQCIMPASRTAMVLCSISVGLFFCFFHASVPASSAAVNPFWKSSSVLPFAWW